MTTSSIYMLAALILTLLVEFGSGNSQSNRTLPLLNSGVSDSGSCETMRLDAIQIRKEGYAAMNRADSIREQAYRAKDEALDLKEEALEVRETAASSRSLLESRLVETLVDTFTLIRSQTTVTNLYMSEIKSSLNSVMNKINEIEEKFTTMEETVKDNFETLNGKVGELKNEVTALERQTAALEEQATKTTSMSEEVSQPLAATLTLKDRQQTYLSEVRLISLYKPTGQTSTWSGPGHESELISDGQYIFDQHAWPSMATYSHTGINNANSKIWLELGGWFRIHKVKIWNIRHCCMERMVGSLILADTKLIGTISHAQSSYDFTMSEEDPTYARKVTLHQPREDWLHILELQVWGSGPFSEQDKFA